MWTDEPSFLYDRSKLRSHLTDGELTLIEPLLPPAKRAAASGRWSCGTS
jgi:hypothetical protein